MGLFSLRGRGKGGSIPNQTFFSWSNVSLGTLLILTKKTMVMAVILFLSFLVQPMLMFLARIYLIRMKIGSLSPGAVMVAIGRAYQGVNDLEKGVRDTEKGQKICKCNFLHVAKRVRGDCMPAWKCHTMTTYYACVTG